MIDSTGILDPQSSCHHHIESSCRVSFNKKILNRSDPDAPDPDAPRWKLRGAIRLVNETLAELHVEQHPDKTFIGRISRGFDFLGYAFTPAGLEVASQTVERCVQLLSQLYEQGVDMIHIGAYVRRWQRWAKSGLAELGARLGWLALCRVVAPLCVSFLRCSCGVPCCPAFIGHNIGDAADPCQTHNDEG